jgi:hypothetical protein
VKLAARRAMDGSSGGRGVRPAISLKGPIVQVALIGAASGLLFWLVWLYGNGLRDARYLDGWVLAAGMCLQIYFHVAVRSARLSPKALLRWRTVHILAGYAVIAAFLSHTTFTLPDTGLEWALWVGFAGVALSGVFGTYLAWSLKSKHGIDAGFSFERIPVRRDELAREAHAAVTRIDAPADHLALPATPYDAWILDLYAHHLRDFFQGPSHFAAHLIGSQRAVKRLTDEIDTLSRFVDPERQEKLAALKELVSEKDRLDFARVYLGMTKGWLLVHVPLTYGLIVLSVLHVFVVYAYSSEAW